MRPQHDDHGRHRARRRAATTTTNVIQTPSLRGRGVLDLHVVVDDPRLPPDFGDDPARFHREHGRDAGDRRDPAGTTRDFGMSRRKIQHEPVPDRQAGTAAVPMPDHDVPREVDRVDLRGSSAGRRPGPSRAPRSRCSCRSFGSESHDASPGIVIPPVTVPSEFRWPSSVSGTSLSVFGTSSIAANFVGSLL